MKWNAYNIKSEFGFDVVGVMRQENKSIIVLGLETEPDKNLDEFIGGDKDYATWCFSGFKKYFSPIVDKFLIEFEKIDKDVKPFEGYDKSVNIKELAIKTGIGFQGRNTLVINKKFHSRLRFRMVVTTLDIEPTGNGHYSKEKNVHCDECRLCELVCPVELLKDYRLIDPDLCLAHKQLTNRKPSLVRCNLCWIACSKDLYWAKYKQSKKNILIKMLLPEHESMYNQ